MSLHDELRRIGHGALLGAVVLVILALLVQALARRAPAAPPTSTVTAKTQDRLLHPRELLYAPSVTLEHYRRQEASPAWLTAQTQYPIPLPRERTGEAPAAVATPSVVQKETGRPEKAACVKVGRRTVWEGRYRWRCRR